MFLLEDQSTTIEKEAIPILKEILCITNIDKKD